MDSMVSTPGSLSLQIKEHVWQGGKNFHLILFNLILTSSHSSIPNWRKSKVKEAFHVSFAFFVVSPLCLFHSSLLCPLLAQWTLCALWPLNDYFSGILAFTFFYISVEPVPHLLPNHEAVVWPFIRTPPSQVMEFYNLEQRAKLGEGSGIVLGVRKSWPRNHSRVHWCEDFLDHL